MVKYLITKESNYKDSKIMAIYKIKKWLYLIGSFFIVWGSLIVIFKFNEDNEKLLCVIAFSFFALLGLVFTVLVNYTLTRKKIVQDFFSTSVNGQAEIVIEREENVLEVKNKTVNTIYKYDLTTLKKITPYKDILVFKFNLEKLYMRNLPELREIFKEFF